jgi:hypothetical protein
VDLSEGLSRFQPRLISPFLRRKEDPMYRRSIWFDSTSFNPKGVTA